MQNVKNILNSLLQPSDQKEAWKINLIKNWPTIIGSLHEKVSLQKINATSVVLGVYDSSWIQELYLLSKLILKKINNHLDRPRIETLRFQCVEDSYSTKSADKRREQALKQKSKKIYKEHALPLKPQEFLALQKIRDPQLSDALQGFLRKCQE